MMFMSLLLISILDKASTIPLQPNELNMEFNTIIDIERKNSGLTFLGFLNSVLNAFQQVLSIPYRQQKNDILPKFLKGLCKIFKKYTDNDLKFVVNSVQSEYDSYDQGDHIENPFIDNPKVKLFFQDTLNQLERDGLKKVINEPQAKNNGTVDVEFFDLLTQLFSIEDFNPLQGYLRRFDEYPKHRNKFKLYSVIKNLLHYSLIEKYDRLDKASRSKLNKKINELFEKKFEKSDNLVFKTIDDDYIEFRHDMKNDFKGLTENATSKRINTVIKQTTVIYRQMPSCGLTTGVTKKMKLLKIK